MSRARGEGAAQDLGVAGPGLEHVAGARELDIGAPAEPAQHSPEDRDRADRRRHRSSGPKRGRRRRRRPSRATNSAFWAIAAAAAARRS